MKTLEILNETASKEELPMRELISNAMEKCAKEFAKWVIHNCIWIDDINYVYGNKPYTIDELFEIWNNLEKEYEK